MAETRTITLTEENWKNVDELLMKIPDSEFLRFCVMNEIVGKGVEIFQCRICTGEEPV